MADTNVLMYDGLPIMVSQEPESLNERMADYSAEEQAKMHIVFSVEELD